MALPTDYANLSGWWDASQESFANNDPVGTITDKSGNSRNLTGAGAARPTFKTAMFPRGGSGFDFDGTDDAVTSAATFETFAPAAAYSFAFLFIANTIGTANANSYDNDAVFCETNGNCSLYLHSTTPTAGLGHWDGADKKQTQTIVTGTACVITGRYDGTNIYIAKDGGAEASTAAGTRSAGGFFLRFGANYNSAQFADITIAEGFFYSVARTAGEMATMASYLTGKWISAPVIPTPRTMRG